MTLAPFRVARQTPLAAPPWFTITGSPVGRLGWDAQRPAVYHNGKTYLAFVDLDANARVAAFDHQTRAMTLSPPIVSSGLTQDVHCTPTLLVRQSDSRLLLAVAPHATAHIYLAVSTNPEDVTAWGAASDIAGSLGATTYTYANLTQLSGESGKIYLFYRDFVTGTSSGNLAFSTSTDNGATWAAQTTLYAVTGKGCYWAITSDDTTRIDFAVSDGNAFDGDAASVYHFYYDGSYRTTDGTVIGAGLPLGPASLTKIYDSSNGYTRVPCSLMGGTAPIVALAAYDPAGSASNEHYWYCTYSGGAWHANEIATSGAPPSPDFSEGGVAIDRISADTVYVSRLISGVWQIVRKVTADGGATWTTEQLTYDSGNDVDTRNLLPVSPHNADPGLRVSWAYGPHWHDTVALLQRSSAVMRGYPNPRAKI